MWRRLLKGWVESVGEMRTGQISIEQWEIVRSRKNLQCSSKMPPPLPQHKFPAKWMMRTRTTLLTCHLWLQTIASTMAIAIVIQLIHNTPFYQFSVCARMYACACAARKKWAHTINDALNTMANTISSRIQHDLWFTTHHLIVYLHSYHLKW